MDRSKVSRSRSNEAVEQPRKAKHESDRTEIRSTLAFSTAILRASWAFLLSSAWFQIRAMFTPRASNRFTAWDLRVAYMLHSSKRVKGQTTAKRVNVDEDAP